MRTLALAFILPILLLISCNSAVEAPAKKSASAEEAPLKSAKGESCAKTDDCEVGLRCIDLKCVTPEGAAGLPESQDDTTTATPTSSQFH